MTPDVTNLRVILKAIEAELRDSHDDSERASVEIASACEYHKGRASALAQARKLLNRFSLALRQSTRGRK